MPEFLSLVSPDEALKLLFSVIDPKVTPEDTQADKALGRVTAEDILSPQDLPDFQQWMDTQSGQKILMGQTKPSRHI